MKKIASAHWQGGIKDGKGTISTESGAMNKVPYGFNTRFEDQPGSNPEELLGAAHAGCFSMALSKELGDAGMTAESIDTRAEVTQVSAGCLTTQDGRTFDTDETLWVTQAGGPAWLQTTGLTLDEHGFIQVNALLQTLTDPKVFAAGDVASFAHRPLEKAGVFA